ncbi:hypothetical protein [Roseicitreum antarcticum]|uniref:Uncharacterized protein n=1 Tax=Roseicitreum antarcticum TaxID=564137 RepID=A0A1H2XEH3_9RHOB|nr:hypothetical protein [Roseicitreum antarcticum]SDW91322.1 hypothetical protein SAMN04488238_104167 [Roseicitreum antarcticum]
MFYRHSPPGTPLDDNMIIMPGAVFMQILDDNPGAGTALLGEIKAIYAGIGSDVLHFLRNGNAVDKEEYSNLLDQFRETQGFSLLQEAAVTQRLCKRIIKRGRIQSDDEYYAIQELLCDLSQEILSAGDLAEVARLAVTYEARV